MNINNIAWLTDIHLNFLEFDERKAFYQNVNESDSDAILITGDIAEATNICELLTEFSLHTSKIIYFVLGNHDYYHGSVANVRKKITTLCSKNKKLVWLGKPEISHMNNHTILVGHDGWADARYGNFDRSTVALNDSRLIAELFQAHLLNKLALKNQMQQLANADADALEKTLNNAINSNIKKVIIATHIPPFPESCCHNGKMSDENWLPYFASKATGDIIFTTVQKHPEVNFLVLCGHTHSASLFKPYENLEIRAGAAEYYRPQSQEMIII